MSLCCITVEGSLNNARIKTKKLDKVFNCNTKLLLYPFIYLFYIIYERGTKKSHGFQSCILYLKIFV